MKDEKQKKIPFSVTRGESQRALYSAVETALLARDENILIDSSSELKFMCHSDGTCTPVGLSLESVVWYFFSLSFYSNGGKNLYESNLPGG